MDDRRPRISQNALAGRGIDTSYSSRAPDRDDPSAGPTVGRADQSDAAAYLDEVRVEVLQIEAGFGVPGGQPEKGEITIQAEISSDDGSMCERDLQAMPESHTHIHRWQPFDPDAAACSRVPPYDDVKAYP